MRAWCTSPAQFLADLEDVLPSPAALLFEEVQHLDEAGLFLKGVVDMRPGCPVLATGSSSFHLIARTRESLAGRATRVRLLPFGLEELSASEGDMPRLIAESRRRERYERMLLYGGYPEPWLSNEPSLRLGELVESVVVRDASDRFRIDEPVAFRKLLRLMAGQVGNLVCLSEWAAICGVSAKTVARYASILEESHIVSLVRPWLSGKRAELTSAPKVFFIDNGIRNAVLGRFAALDRRDDLGALAENWVYGEICKATHPLLDGVGHWRTRSGAEVDFVVELGGRIVAVEVKAGPSPRRRLSRSARSFIAAARPDRFLMIHGGETGEEEVDGCLVVWAGPTRLVEELRRDVPAYDL